MKKIIICLFFMVAFYKSQAQIIVTPELGYNQSTFFTTNDANQNTIATINNFQLGALISKPILGALLLQSGLEYAQKGAYIGRGPQYVYGSNTTLNLNYLQVPLQLGSIIKIDKKWAINLSAGFYGGMGISGTEKGTGIDLNGTSAINKTVDFTNNPPSLDNTKTYIKPFDLGYAFSVGGTYEKFQLRITDSRSFGNISPASSTINKNQVINIYLGYQLSL